MSLQQEYRSLKRKRMLLLILTALGSVLETLLFLFFTVLYRTTDNSVAPFFMHPLYYGLIVGALALAICFAMLIPAETLRLLSDPTSKFYSDRSTQAVGFERCKSVDFKMSIICGVAMTVTILSIVDIAILAFTFSFVN